MSTCVRTGGTTYDFIPADTCELRIDILLTREPWWMGRTESNPYFDRHLPFGGNDRRPRAATYARKFFKQISRSQIFQHTSSTSDCFWVTVNNMNFLNVNRDFQRPLAMHPLLHCRLITRSVATGDFNSVYWA